MEMQRLPGLNVANRLEKRQLLIAINCLAGLSIFFFGYDQGMMGGVNNAKNYIDLMGFGHVDEATGEPVVTDSLLQGGIVSVYYLGTLVGCLHGGWLGDRVGRVRTVAAGAAWGIVGAAVQASAMGPSWMICARVVNGVGTGMLNAIVPVYAAECVEHTSRGQFIAIEFTLNIFGVVVAYWLEFGLSFVDGGASAVRWRFPVAVQALFLLVLLAAVWFFPESPRWLVKAGRDREAAFVLRRLRGSDDRGRARADAELRDIRQAVELEAEAGSSSGLGGGGGGGGGGGSGGTSYVHMLFGIGSGDLHIGRRVQLVVWLEIFQEWVGIAGVTIYAPTIFRMAGYDAIKSQWISGLNNVFYMLATVICVFTLDRVGRRRTLFWGALGQGVSMILAGAFSRLGLAARDAGDVALAESYGAAAASFVFVFTFIFGASWLATPWVYPAEIFPLQVRAKGNAWGVVGWSIGNGWLTLLCPVMFGAIGESTLYIFGACNFLVIPIICMCSYNMALSRALYPESSQRTLEEIDLLFSASTPWAWDAEKKFAQLKAERPELVQATHVEKHAADDPEVGSVKDAQVVQKE